VQPHAIREGRRVRGEVTAVLERSAHPIGGTIEYDGSFYYLIPDEAKYYVDFLVPEKHLNGAKAGDKVAAVLVRWEHANASPEARVTDVLGQSGQAGAEFAVIRKEFGLPADFPQEVDREAEAHSVHKGRPPRGRTDLRKELIITIDPVDARDFDDALSLRKLSNGHVELGVHIADVSFYVPEDSELDKEALKRGNSTYLVDGVVPMLPEHLSNNICSLVPNEPRFAFSVFMEFSARGTLKNYRIEETLILSKRRFTYEEVEIIEGADGDHRDLIMDLHALSKTLFDKRMKEGGIDFETQEVKYLLDENKIPVGAVVKTKTDATSLVEECMLSANKTVAEHVASLKKTWKTQGTPPLIYRIHEPPDKEKLSNAIEVVRAVGIDVPNKKLGPKEINDILHAARGRTEQPVVNTLLLRSMAKAVYSELNVGHFGLGFQAYAHFTSPIRRYPDLIVHRYLKEYAKGRPSNGRWKVLNAKAADASDHTTITERNAIDAERASQKLAQVMIARERLGQTFDGYINGVTSFGVFVMLDELMIEGLLHIKDLGDDYYIFDERRFRLIGKRTKRVLHMGGRLTVRIANADVDKRTIDLAAVDDQRRESPARTSSETTARKKSSQQTKSKRRSPKRRSRES
jgi:ribonuclease R